jgi:malonate-semialdehyde dehydrogenase (acetylating)/methylmalonate-semialdehyde dehydrogenase
MRRAARAVMARAAAPRTPAPRAFSSAAPAVPTVPLLIDGQRVTSAATQFADVFNPATNALLCRTPLATPDELQRAVASAADAAHRWREVPVTVR